MFRTMSLAHHIAFRNQPAWTPSPFPLSLSISHTHRIHPLSIAGSFVHSFSAGTAHDYMYHNKIASGCKVNYTKPNHYLCFIPASWLFRVRSSYSLALAPAHTHASQLHFVHAIIHNQKHSDFARIFQYNFRWSSGWWCFSGDSPVLLISVNRRQNCECVLNGLRYEAFFHPFQMYPIRTHTHTVEKEMPREDPSHWEKYKEGERERERTREGLFANISNKSYTCKSMRLMMKSHENPVVLATTASLFLSS